MSRLARILAGAALMSAAPAFADPPHRGGANNSVAIVQNGDGNAVRLTQSGSDHNATLVQNGDDNRLKLKQFGSGETATIVQNGGERATVIQGSPGNGDPRRVGMQRHLD